MKTMVDFLNFHLRTNVPLLADVLERFIRLCLALDSCHYFSGPGLIWEAMLKMTGVKVELILNIDMYERL